jgi:molybdopterin-guanine dinucleotide biosynthesis protein B
MKIFSIIGYHHSGKTTAVENLIRYIKSTGQTISSIKDIHAEDFTMETPGSNSHRHLTASETNVFARGLNETYLIWNKQLTLHEMLPHLTTDWVVIEGMKSETLPQIIAAKNTEDIDKLLSDRVFAITGPVSETITEYKGFPCINAITDTEKLGSLVIKHITTQPIPTRTISIKFNDTEVYLNEWVEAITIDTITAFCKNLKGYKAGDEITIRIL